MLIFYFFFAHIHFAHSSHLLSLHNFGTFVMKPFADTVHNSVGITFPKATKDICKIIFPAISFHLHANPLKMDEFGCGDSVWCMRNLFTVSYLKSKYISIVHTLYGKHNVYIWHTVFINYKDFLCFKVCLFMTQCNNCTCRCVKLLFVQFLNKTV